MTEVSEATLRGSRCDRCDNVAYPAARSCQRCGAEAMQAIDLGRQGTVWGFTVQRFAPKSPPYVPPTGGFRPFAMGYVELPDGIRVAGILEAESFDDLIGSEATLVATEPVPHFEVAGR